jgi:formylglycine-generating enzyme required for sulfatase activity
VGVFAFPAPKVSDIQVATRMGPKGTVAVSYRLSEPAIVLCDVLTNVTDEAGTRAVSIGRTRLCSFTGDVGHKIEPGARSFVWLAGKDWPSNKISSASVQVQLTAYPTNRPPRYLVVDLAPASGERLRYYAAAEDIPGYPESDLYRTRKLVMRFIRAKNVPWTMGAIAEDVSNNDYHPYEVPHTVRLRSNYWIGVFEMTVGQYAWVSDGSAAAKTNHLPLCRFGVYNSVRGANALYPAPPAETSHMGRLRARTGIHFDLPTEAQWEFAARAHCGEGYWSDGSLMTLFNLTNGVGQAVMKTNANKLERAGNRRPNNFGLYDTMGNVFEYCLDWRQKSIAWNTNGVANADGAFLADGQTPGTQRVVRGGYYASVWRDVRPVYRYTSVLPENYIDGTGYRVVSLEGLE